MTEAKKQVAYANSEFKAASTALGDWSKSSDGISAKLKQLNSNLKSQEAVLEEYEKTLEEVKKQYGKTSDEAREYETRLNNQKAVVNKTKSEIKKFEGTLDEVTKAEKMAAASGKTVEEVLDDMHKKAENAGDGFTVLKGAVATFAGNVLTSLVSGIKDAAGSLLGLADSTREYRTELAKLETGAEQAGASADYIKDKWIEMGSVLGDEGAITEGLNNLLAAGFTTEKEMDAITKSLEGAAIKWKDTLKFEGLADGLQETLATGSAVGSFAEMLERSGVSLDEFNAGLAECKTEADKQNYVLQELSELGLAEVSDAYREQNKDLIAANEAQAELTDTMADMGKKIEPVTTTLKEGFNGLLEKLLELVGGVDMEAFTAAIEEGFKVVTDEVLPAIKEGLQWIIDNKDILLTGIVAIGAGMLAWNVTSIISKVVTAIGGMVSAIIAAKNGTEALNIAMKANIIGVIVTLLASLVAAFIYLWNTSDEFRQFWINLWEIIKEKTSEVVQAIAQFFSNLYTGITNKFKSIGSWFSQKWQSIKDGAKNLKENVAKFFSDAYTSITNKFKSIGSWFSNRYSDIKNAFSNIGSWFGDKFQQAYNSITNTFGKLGDFFTGVWNTITGIFKKVGTTVSDAITGSVRSAINGVLSGATNIINGFIRAINAAIGVINAIPGVSISKLSELSVPALAKGGIVDSATLAQIGEAGREAVIPLERNTGWMRGLAKELVSEMSRGNSNSITGNLSGGSGVVNNFTQNNYSPKPLNRVEIYRNTKNILGLAGGV